MYSSKLCFLPMFFGLQSTCTNTAVMSDSIYTCIHVQYCAYIHYSYAAQFVVPEVTTTTATFVCTDIDMYKERLSQMPHVGSLWSHSHVLMCQQAIPESKKREHFHMEYCHKYYISNWQSICGVVSVMKLENPWNNRC